MATVLFLIALGLAVVPLARMARRHQARTAWDRRRRSQIPDALERIAAGLRSGASLTQTLADTGRATPPPLGPELAQLARTTDAGRSLLAALQQWAETHDDASTRMAATALALATRVGAAPGRAVDGVATTLRERRALAAERHAQATQARTSAIVLSAAPLGFTGLLVLTNQAAASFLFTTPFGWLCVALGLTLDAVGALWMARLTRSGTTW